MDDPSFTMKKAPEGPIEASTDVGIARRGLSSETSRRLREAYLADKQATNEILRAIDSLGDEDFLNFAEDLAEGDLLKAQDARAIIQGVQRCRQNGIIKSEVSLLRKKITESVKERQPRRSPKAQVASVVAGFMAVHEQEARRTPSVLDAQDNDQPPPAVVAPQASDEGRSRRESILSEVEKGIEEVSRRRKEEHEESERQLSEEQEQERQVCDRVARKTGRRPDPTMRVLTEHDEAALVQEVVDQLDGRDVPKYR